jgi:hypothetical protein
VGAGGVREDFAKPHYRNLYCFASDVKSAIGHVQAYKPIPLESKWF